MSSRYNCKPHGQLLCVRMNAGNPRDVLKSHGDGVYHIGSISLLISSRGNVSSEQRASNVSSGYVCIQYSLFCSMDEFS